MYVCVCVCFEKLTKYKYMMIFYTLVRYDEKAKSC